MRRHFPKMTIERAVVAAKIFDKDEQSLEMPREELYQRITRAAAEIGIEDVIIVEIDPNKSGSGNINGFARPRKYVSGEVQKEGDHDLGYIKFEGSRSTAKSFIIHYDTFSHKRGEQFRLALLAQRLKPQSYDPSVTTLFYTKSELDWEKVKDQKAEYR